MRAFWKGTVSFGLINIPVGLYTAARENELKFKLLHEKDLSEIRYARICKIEDKEVPYDEIVKGIEKNGRYVVMGGEDFEKAKSEKTDTIQIVSFCDAAEIESIYFEKPYFLKPDKLGAKAYYLLKQALVQLNKVAVAYYAMRSQNHIAVIYPHEHVLVLNQLRFHSEIADPLELEIQKTLKVEAQELKMAKMLIEQLSGKFNPEMFHNEYVEKLQKTIKRKSKSSKAKPVKKEAEDAKVFDIMSLLKASLEKKRAKSR